MNSDPKNPLKSDGAADEKLAAVAAQNPYGGVREAESRCRPTTGPRHT